MRFVTYRHGGELFHGRIADDDTTVEELGSGELLHLLEHGTLDSAAPPVRRLPLAEVTLLAPLLRPPKLLAVAANYASHVVNSGGTPVDPQRATPRLFLKPSSAIAGHDAPLTPPRDAEQVDWEVELAVVIGRRCRDVPVDDALAVVAGYMTANDISVRAFRYDIERDEQSIHPFFDWIVGKWPDGFAAFGPWLVRADAVENPQDLELRLEVNGEVRQLGSTSELIFGVAELIAYASTRMTLEPGDVILTGTTGGAGIETGVFLEPGDVMVASVGDLGTIRTVVEPWHPE